MAHCLTTNDNAIAIEFYGLIVSGQPRQFIDYLIDHPDVQIDSETLQTALAFPEHRDVARAAYSIGETAATLGLARPWTEAQRGYTMTAAQAELLDWARQQSIQPQSR